MVKRPRPGWEQRGTAPLGRWGGAGLGIAWVWGKGKGGTAPRAIRSGIGGPEH